MRALSQLRRLFLAIGLTVAFSLGIAGGVALVAGNIAHDQVSQQLAQEKIVFPKAGSKQLTELPAADRAIVAQFAGQKMTTGDQAKAYADNYVLVHMMKSSGGKTYAEMDREDPARASVLSGNSIRGMLLSAYAWWTAGAYAILAGYALLALSVVMFVVTFVANRFAPKTDKAFAASPAYATA